MRFRHAAAAAALAAAPAGCGWQGPKLAGYPGLEWTITSYYDARAVEASAACPQPHMDGVSSARVVEDTPRNVVMDVRYHWRDESMGASGQAPTSIGCDDWGRRTFTFGKRADGGLEVLSMTGPQRQQG